MKPFIIYLNYEEEKVSLTREEFEKVIKEAYDAGYNDGYSKGKDINWSKWNWFSPPTITTPQYITTTPNTYDPNKIEITCNAKNTSFAPGADIKNNSNLFIHGDDAIEKVVPPMSEAFNTVGDKK